METFNLSQSYPTQDIRKRTSFLTIGLSICLLAAGISLFSYRKAPQNPILMP